jgi:putative transcriptional regulator
MKNLLPELRKEYGITQQELADMVEVSRQTIIAIELEKFNPSVVLAFKVAKVFKKSIEDIFIYEEEVK